MKITRSIKNAIVPNETRYWRIPFGLCAGCYLPINLQNQFLRYMSLYERELFPYFRAYVKGGMCCYDIGGAYGDYALALAKLTGEGGVIYTFEAQPEVFEQLPETLRRNAHLRAKITPYNFFVGATHDTSQRFVSIDGMIETMGCLPPQFIKMDVEGAEYDVLQGGKTAIKQHHPKIIIEVHSADLEHQCLDFLHEHAYKTTIVDQQAILGKKEYRPTQHNRWICAE